MSENTHDDDELLFEELNKIAATINEDIEIAKATEESLVELKSEDFWPIYDEYYGSVVVGQISVPDPLIETDIKAAKKKLKDPKGGLTAAGRAYFKRKEGANLKPGVKGPADTPEKMRRKGSFLTRFFTNPSGPMVDDKGRATRLALSAAAWGEPVPKNAEDAAALAAKGRRLLDRYASSKKKKSDEISDLEYKAALGATIGESAGMANQNPTEAVDKDQDGLVFDGTPQETRKPKKYEKLPNSFLEKRRRRFVRDELKKRGIQATPGETIQEHDDGSLHRYGRSEKERLARSDARDAFNRDEDRKKFVRNQLRKAGITPTAKASERSDEERAARRAARAEYDRRERAGAPKKKPQLGTPPKPKPKYPPGYEPGKPADRYPDPPKPRDAEAERMERLRPPARDRKPADRYPEPTKPRDAEAERMERMRPPAKDRKPADRYPNPEKPKPKEKPVYRVKPTFPGSRTTGNLIRDTFNLDG